ncbi:transposable element Tcb2 transposase [Trichonephila clavipes]|nr:transposable element Tcb2 transposase [Trichonephila clavipes]
MRRKSNRTRVPRRRQSVVMEYETLQMQTNWEGPYTVLRRPNDVVVGIQKSPHSKPMSVTTRLWQRFQDDGNESKGYRTGHLRVTTLNENRYIWQLLPKQTDGAQHQTCLVSSLQLPVRQFQGRPFSLQSDSRRTLIWRALGTRYYQENTIERHRYGGAGWLVWLGIILGSKTDLHVQSVTMTGHIYRNVILEQHVRLFRGTMGAEFRFMDDNAHPHRANIVDECLQSEGITRMDWPAYALDLNPIEHVWDMLGR